MISDLVYLVNFLNTKIYLNFYQKKFFILARKSHQSLLTSSNLRKDPKLVWKKKQKQNFQVKIVSYNY